MAEVELQYPPNPEATHMVRDHRNRKPLIELYAQIRFRKFIGSPSGRGKLASRAGTENGVRHFFNH